MLLTIDVGNTNISCGIFDGDKLISTFRFITKQARTNDELALQLYAILAVKNIDRAAIKAVIISSVVPKINNDLISAVKQCFNVEPMMVDSNSNIGIKIDIENPNSCGADLIVDVVAAYNYYKRDCLVVDFGTATKFLYISEDGIFKYGIISPGLEITANSLWEMTAQLPQIQLKKPTSILAKETISSMQAGVVYGYIGLTEGIVNNIKKEIGHDFPVLATGGLARYIYPETAIFTDYIPDLAYQGMKIIFERSVNNE